MKKVITIEDMRQLAVDRRGKCLSESYVNSTTKLLWECSEGHQWEAIPSSIKRGSWCSYCAGRGKLTIEDMREIAKNHGGKCLSDTYSNAHAKLLWECSEGHQWEAASMNMRQQGSWCPTCSRKRRGKSQRLSIEEMHKVAKERGGKCLSDNYKTARINLLWECSEGHQWEAAPDKIKRGRWCPVCSSGLGERVCRSLFEQVFNHPFPKAFPDWLVNDRGNQMELDGYCERLNLAFEHQGIQHYKETGFFHEDTNQFIQRQLDDKDKIMLCAQHDVQLIQIPELFSLLKLEDFWEYLVKELSRRGIKLPEGVTNKSLEFSRAYQSSIARANMEELKLIASVRRGKCLSESYVNNTAKLLWECSEGHQWEAIPSSIKRGSWCPYCAGRGKLTIEDMREIAEERGGECLSDTYSNAHAKLLWECGKKHIWEATSDKVKRGSWCPVCSGNVRLDIESIQRIAKERGGECLTDSYINVLKVINGRLVLQVLRAVAGVQVAIPSIGAHLKSCLLKTCEILPMVAAVNACQSHT